MNYLLLSGDWHCIGIWTNAADHTNAGDCLPLSFVLVIVMLCSTHSCSWFSFKQQQQNIIFWLLNGVLSWCYRSQRTQRHWLFVQVDADLHSPHQQRDPSPRLLRHSRNRRTRWGPLITTTLFVAEEEVVVVLVGSFCCFDYCGCSWSHLVVCFVFDEKFAYKPSTNKGRTTASHTKMGY